jgi:hypothetical protein
MDERWQRTRSLGWGVFGACVLAAVVTASTVRDDVTSHHLSDAERQAVGRAAAREEPRWRLKGLHSYPDDCWSQDDDVSSSEHTWAIEEAGRRGVPVTDIFRAIDEDLRAHPVLPPRKANACPCKPRPFYD